MNPSACSPCFPWAERRAGGPDAHNEHISPTEARNDLNERAAEESGTGSARSTSMGRQASVGLGGHGGYVQCDLQKCLPRDSSSAVGQLKVGRSGPSLVP